MDSFCEFYRKDFIFANQKECSEATNKVYSDIAEWKREKDIIIHGIMDSLPDSDFSIIIMDALKWTSHSDPPVSFDILVRKGITTYN